MERAVSVSQGEQHTDGREDEPKQSREQLGGGGGGRSG